MLLEIGLNVKLPLIRQFVRCPLSILSQMLNQPRSRRQELWFRIPPKLPLALQLSWDFKKAKYNELTEFRTKKKI